jgi:hypothetical protein
MRVTMASLSTAADQSQLLARFQKAADDFADVFAIAVGYFPVGEESARREWVNGFRGPLASTVYRCDGTRYGRSGSPWHYLIVRHHSQSAARLVDATRRLERLAEDYCRLRDGQRLTGAVNFLDAIRPADDSPVWDAYTSPGAIGGGCVMRVKSLVPADRHRFTIVDNPFDVAITMMKGEADRPDGCLRCRRTQHPYTLDIDGQIVSNLTFADILLIEAATAYNAENGQYGTLKSEIINRMAARKPKGLAPFQYADPDKAFTTQRARTQEKLNKHSLFLDLSNHILTLVDLRKKN